jgi:hypothetical protein
MTLQLENARLQVCDVRRLRQKSLDLTATHPLNAAFEPTRQLQKEGSQHFATAGWMHADIRRGTALPLRRIKRASFVAC